MDKKKAEQTGQAVQAAGQEVLVLQFKITLLDVKPPIWRRIQVPADYTFWDLHVAIQDAMGWLDCHLHEYGVKNPLTGGIIRIGIPDPDVGPLVDEVVPGWELKIMDHFKDDVKSIQYLYDFGDDWMHKVTLEKTLPRDAASRYPKCIKGARSCPPEDCGGPLGYESFLQAYMDKRSKRHREVMQWIGPKFDPEMFDPQVVRFDDPRERLKRALQ